MQIVIGIDDKLYERITVKKEYFLEDGEDLCSAIENGVPLSKRHGRLIDADQAISKICGSACGCRLEECGFDKPCYSVTRIKSAPTIIEADEVKE